jgi:hypothetical protein
MVKIRKPEIDPFKDIDRPNLLQQEESKIFNEPSM